MKSSEQIPCPMKRKSVMVKTTHSSHHFGGNIGRESHADYGQREVERSIKENTTGRDSGDSRKRRLKGNKRSQM